MSAQQQSVAFPFVPNADEAHRIADCYPAGIVLLCSSTSGNGFGRITTATIGESHSEIDRIMTQQIFGFVGDTVIIFGRTDFAK